MSFGSLDEKEALRHEIVAYLNKKLGPNAIEIKFEKCRFGLI